MTSHMAELYLSRKGLQELLEDKNIVNSVFGRMRLHLSSKKVTEGRAYAPVMAFSVREMINNLSNMNGRQT